MAATIPTDVRKQLDALTLKVTEAVAPAIEAAIVAALSAPKEQAKPKAKHEVKPTWVKPTWLVEAEKEGKPKAKPSRTPKVAPSSVKREGKKTSRFLRNIKTVGHWQGSEGMSKAERSLSERKRLGAKLGLDSIKLLTLADLRALCNAEGIDWVHSKATTKFHGGSKLKGRKAKAS